MKLPHRFLVRVGRIAYKFGLENQMKKYMEETGECVAELGRLMQKGTIERRISVCEEMADVFIVMIQILILLDSKYPKLKSTHSHLHLFSHFIEEKLTRTELRKEAGYYDEI